MVQAALNKKQLINEKIICFYGIMGIGEKHEDKSKIKTIYRKYYFA